MKRNVSTAIYCLIACWAVSCHAAPMFESLSTFGGGDGQVVQGDAGAAYLTTGSTERGLGYNRVTNRVYVPSRAGGNKVVILDGDTGAEIQTVTMPAGVTGGLFPINQIAVDHSGAIYLANLTTATSSTAPFKVYRFADEAALISGTFTTAYSGELTTGHRYGDIIDLRGTGASTQIAVPAGSANTSLAILTTSDGLNFTPTIFSTVGLMVPANDAGPARQGIAFGDGNVLWGKESGERLFRATFDLGTATLTSTNVYTTAQFPATGGALEYVENLDLLAFNIHGPNRELRIYDVSDLVAGPQLVQSFPFAINNADANVAGAITNIANGRIYSFMSNNGIVAIVVPEPAAWILGGLAAMILGGMRRQAR